MNSAQREPALWPRYQETRKPSFLTYYNYHHATIRELFLASGMNPSLIEAVCAQIAVPEHVAAALIEALNKVAGTHYTLDDMYIPLHKEDTAQ